MKRQIRINEYYDLFDVKLTSSSVELKNNDSLPTAISNTFKTNPFQGFNNFEQSSTFSSVSNLGSAYNPPPTNTGARDLIQVTGKQAADGTYSSLKVDEDGSIWCYPPNVSVPCWDRLIFRNFDYTVQPHNITSASTDDSVRRLAELIDDLYLFSYECEPMINSELPIPEYTIGIDGKKVKLWGVNKSADANLPSYYKCDFTNYVGNYAPIKDYVNVPIFLKFDNYQSKSKVIFSGCDKSRNPDIEFRFGYEHGSNEPIKFNLSLSANNRVNDVAGTSWFNQNLTKNEIEKLMVKCYWCVEWIHEPKTNFDMI